MSTGDNKAPGATESLLRGTEDQGRVISTQVKNISMGQLLCYSPQKWGDCFLFKSGSGIALESKSKPTEQKLNLLFCSFFFFPINSFTQKDGAKPCRRFAVSGNIAQVCTCRRNRGCVCKKEMCIHLTPAERKPLFSIPLLGLRTTT